MKPKLYRVVKQTRNDQVTYHAERKTFFGWGMLGWDGYSFQLITGSDVDSVMTQVELWHKENYPTRSSEVVHTWSIS